MLVWTPFLSVCEPLPGSVFLAPESLPYRLHELPPPHRAVKVVGGCASAYGVLGWLHARGRHADLVPPHAVPPALPHARYRLWEPNPFLQAIVEHNPPPHPSPLAIDLGCGSGREAVYLADRGYRVVAVDRLLEALERGRRLQACYAPDSMSIVWVWHNLETAPWHPPEPPHLVGLFFLFSRGLVLQAWEWLAPNGWLLMEAFTAVHSQRCGRPASPARLASQEAVQNLLPTEAIRHLSADWRENGRHTLRLWAVKPPPSR